MPPRTFLAQERPNWPRSVPEHLSDIADSQVNNLECIVSGTAKQMQLVMAEVQGGNPALHRDDLDAMRAPARLGTDTDEEETSWDTFDRLHVATFPGSIYSRGTPGLESLGLRLTRLLSLSTVDLRVRSFRRLRSLRSNNGSQIRWHWQVITAEAGEL